MVWRRSPVKEVGTFSHVHKEGRLVAKPTTLVSAVALTWMVSAPITARAETITGSVLGPEGEPFAGAAVELA